MIPDDLFNFKQFSTLSNFDTGEVQLHPLLSHVVTPSLAGACHLLLACPVCKQPWYKAGRNEYPRLTPEQLVYLDALLRVDIQALYLLPRALCTICSSLHLGGLFSAETYAYSGGYRLLWESFSPRRIQLLALVCLHKGLPLDMLVQMRPVEFVDPVVPVDKICSMLTWLEMCPSPQAVQALGDAQSRHLAQSFPPGNTVDGSLRQWRGYAWETNCPLLGGNVQVLLAVTARRDALPPFASLQMGWRMLARALRVVL